MKYLKEFKEELNLMFKDERVKSKYSKEDVYNTLYEYWENKDLDPFPNLHPPEYYEELNKVMNDFRKLNPQQKKIYLDIQIKKLKYKGIF